jgi:AcrR family transcriptional regulator
VGNKATTRTSSARATAGRKREVRRARDELYRQLIIDGAERLFAARGVDETRMEEVAAEAGLSLGTLYTVFAGKADLVAAIHDTRLSQLLAASVEEARGGASTFDFLVAGLRGYIRYFLDHPDYLRMHLREGYAWSGEHAAPTRERAAAWTEGLEMLTTLIERGRSDGDFVCGEPAVEARMLIATQQVQLAAWVEQGMVRPAADVLADVESYVCRMFLAKSA